MTFLYAPPDINEVVISWLVLEYGADHVGDERPSDDPLPYRLVQRIAGPDNKITDFPVIQVDTFAADKTAASDAALVTHRRMLALGPPIASQQVVPISGGRTAQIDRIRTTLAPIWQDYRDDKIDRFVARYQIDLRFVAV